MHKKYCNIQEAADIIGVKKNTLQVWCSKKGKYLPQFLQFAVSKGLIAHPKDFIKTKSGKNGWSRCSVEEAKRLRNYFAKYNYRGLTPVE